MARKNAETWVSPKPRFRLHRASDYSPELHAATTRYEAASDAVADAKTPEGYGATLAQFEAAEAARRPLMLALDKQRRPDFYASN